MAEKITVPLLVIHGADDEEVPVSQALPAVEPQPAG
jgi:dipeptidyl aminopeptidase/acylaminoacyl peptidase